jgi:hypothetical protein
VLVSNAGSRMGLTAVLEFKSASRVHHVMLSSQHVILLGFAQLSRVQSG